VNQNVQSAAIYGLAGTVISEQEAVFFREQQPLGFILFARNCDNPDQIRKLTDGLREILQREDVMILIDQEGGRVARLKPPFWRETNPVGIYAKLARIDKEQAAYATYLHYRLIADELYGLGINVNCAPVLDLKFPGAHDIIGDRSFGLEPMSVTMLAQEACYGLLEGGVLPVLKHIPGHGRARADSHESLPEVDAGWDALAKTDFMPFHQLSSMPLAMTAHIRYTALDAGLPATLSPEVIDIIRTSIGFDGVLLTDDLSMKALEGSFADRARSSLEAGCDVVLHCNGEMEEMKSVAEGVIPLDDDALERVKAMWGRLQEPEPIDIEEVIQELEATIEPVI